MASNQLFDFGKASSETRISGSGANDSPMLPFAEPLA